MAFNRITYEASSIFIYYLLYFLTSHPIRFVYFSSDHPSSNCAPSSHLPIGNMSKPGFLLPTTQYSCISFNTMWITFPSQITHPHSPSFTSLTVSSYFLSFFILSHNQTLSISSAHTHTKSPSHSFFICKFNHLSKEIPALITRC